MHYLQADNPNFNVFCILQNTPKYVEVINLP